MARFFRLAVCAATSWVVIGACGGVTTTDRPGAGAGGDASVENLGRNTGVGGASEDASHGNADASDDVSTDAISESFDGSAGTDADAAADVGKSWLCVGGTASVSGTYPGGSFSSSSAVFYRQQGSCIDKIVVLFLPVEGVENAPASSTPAPYLVVGTQNLAGANPAWGELNFGGGEYTGAATVDLASVSPNVVGSFSMLESGFNLSGTFDATHCKVLDQAIQCP